MKSNRTHSFVKLALAGAAALMLTASSFAQTASPTINATQVKQAERINQGVASGELTKAETKNLRTEQRAIRAEKAAFKADGTFSAAERAQVRRDQKQASKRIYANKHNSKKA